jgi:hypothetical protein
MSRYCTVRTRQEGCKVGAQEVMCEMRMAEVSRGEMLTLDASGCVGSGHSLTLAFAL